MHACANDGADKLALSGPVPHAKRVGFAEGLPYRGVARCRPPVRPAEDVAKQLGAVQLIDAEDGLRVEVPRHVGEGKWGDGKADVAMVYYHLALRYVRIFPGEFEIVCGWVESSEGVCGWSAVRECVGWSAVGKSVGGGVQICTWILSRCNSMPQYTNPHMCPYCSTQPLTSALTVVHKPSHVPLL